MQKNTFFYLFILIMITGCTRAKLLVSPDKSIQVSVNPAEEDDKILSLQILHDGDSIFRSVNIGLKFEHLSLQKPVIRLQSSHLVDENWRRVWGKSDSVRNHYNEGHYVISFAAEELHFFIRVYDDGVAYRYVLPEDMDTVFLISENNQFTFLQDDITWATNYDNHQTHQEAEFLPHSISCLDSLNLIGCPLLIQQDKRVIAITEANLTDWAGLYFKADTTQPLTIDTRLSPRIDYPNYQVIATKNKKSPWRVIMIGDSPKELIESDIIANLNEPCSLDDVSWIKPGKSAWDWWWSNSYAPDVDFKLGANTETMKYFIDFASEMGWEYQLVNWQWYGNPFDSIEGNAYGTNYQANILTPNPTIDIRELVQYGKEKGVKIILWLEWGITELQMDSAFALYEQWGVAGVKVDFMARDDQQMVNFYHRLVKKAAEHKLVVDFHGAYKPTGISRTYPNLITREGVMGNEYNKWSARITPEHTVTLPFTRGLLGEMDFTPGGFVNVRMDSFQTEKNIKSPMVMGTRAHQLAMLLVYESAFQVLCDAPYNYRNSPAGLDFLKVVPTSWDKTKYIDGSIGDYIIIARQKDDVWYLGGMTDNAARTVKVALDFLSEGEYMAQIWKDAASSDRIPTRLQVDKHQVNRSGILEINMVSGGGFVMVLKPVE